MGDEEPRTGRIGLIAGYGRFPILFADKAREKGLRVVAVGIRHEASPELADHVERFYWCGVARVGRLIRLLKGEGIDRAVMAGKVRKTWMFTPLRVFRLLPDWRTLRLWFRRAKDKKDDTLLGAVAEELASEGIRLESSLLFCDDFLAREGILAGRAPTAGEVADIRFGWGLAKAMGGLDVGQSVAVKEQAVLAVEAIEGTDAAIHRAGNL
ncbi:MAG: LpxI family protein, partial [Planctomycetota bacterium]